MRIQHQLSLKLNVLQMDVIMSLLTTLLEMGFAVIMAQGTTQ
jgi:hypothetical protein